MSQNLLPVENLSDESGAPVGPTWAPQDLHARLLSAFSPDAETSADPSPKSQAPAMNVIDATRTLAAATLRQGEAFENCQERVVRLEHGPDVGLIRENVRDLSEALLQITLQSKKASTEAEERFESLSDVMALLSGHMATHRQEAQANIAATAQLSQQLQQLQEVIAGQRAEAAQLKDLILSTGQSLRKELQDDIASQRAEAAQIKELLLSTGQSLRHDLDALQDQAAPLNGKLESQNFRIDAIEGHVAALPGVEAGLASLTVRVDDLEPGAALLANRVEDLESSAASLTGHVEDLKSDSTSLDGRLDAQSQRIAAIEAPVAILPELESSLTSMANQVDGLDSGIASLTGRTGILETCSLSVTTRAEKLESIVASVSTRINDLEPLKGSVAHLAAEDAKLVERLSLAADDLEATKGQVTGLEDAAAALADSSIRSAEGLSMLGNALEAAKTQIFSLNETSEYLTERLRIAEQVVESFTRREKVLAELHARAAHALQSGQ